ncbi:DUF4192 domain-containing protein [Trujillonella humicola]|uniref:DUF4192 domain-containing protein n=1 Tax=Trujillonella humicola TaxID=3383699 RepID=UPI003906612A
MDESLRLPVRVSDPGEVVAALPTLLGFVPDESVVLVALDGGGRVALTVRTDLPAGPRAVPAARDLAGRVVRAEPASVLLVVVSEAPDDAAALPGAPGVVVPGLPHRAVVHHVVLALSGVDVPVCDVLLVRSGRWWSYDCPQPCCAPGAGTPLPGGVSPVAVAAIAAGVVIAPDRAALGARIAPAPGPDAEVLAAAAGQVAGPAAGAGPGWAAVTEALELCRPGTTAAVPDPQLAAVLWALTDLELRDRALGFALGADAPAAEVLWTECTRRAPSPLDAAPAALLAVSAWLRGDGAMANLALERALTSSPGYRLAVLLAGALDGCLPPAALRAVIADLVAETG